MTLEEFSSCEDYIAYNRQTRLLANYDAKDENCPLFKKENKTQLLENSKKVLAEMTYFALTEYEELSQKLFEKTFENSLFIDYNVTLMSGVKYRDELSTKEFVKTIDKKLKEKLIKFNDLDIELYNFAKELFFERIKVMKISIS